MSVRHILAVVLLAGLCACAPPPRLAAPALPPPPSPSRLIDPYAACLKDLRDGRVAFEQVSEYETGGSCGIANPVRVSAAPAGWNRPGVMSCEMARTVSRFEIEVVQPLALRHFGQPVARLHHMGTYDCRTQRSSPKTASAGKGKTAGRLSEHSKGQAIDLGGFELADGTLVSVKRDWRGTGQKSDFLQAVAQASCQSFNVVLTPNHDRMHQDHLHLDIGPHRLCGY
ncbi:MAG: extensin family protein [Magnetospirillum sp.]|nr:extensin family protein [Magnetospirillum sp.]